MKRHSACCIGPYPDDLVEKITSAKAGNPMTADEFMEWLKGHSDQGRHGANPVRA
jgi:hypothetical protein